MKFIDYVKEQCERHPGAQPQDVAKLCFQGAFGAEHLLTDLQKAFDYLEKEFANVKACGEQPLFENISKNYTRVNIAPWKQSGMPVEWLFSMFSDTASGGGQGENIIEMLDSVSQAAADKGFSFTAEQWETFRKNYEQEGIRAVHHSESHRNSERPAYRIVERRFTRLFPILQRLAQGKSCKKSIIAIDGRSASGKTTVANELGKITGGQIIHMDDFFLPAQLRTPERLSEVGGNIHYERFASEILPKLADGEDFSYRPYDCGKMAYGDEIKVCKSPYYIVEGAYSCHPIFKSYMDIRVFSDISQDEQSTRILKRNGEKMLEMFSKKWIPMEERYIKELSIKEFSHILI